MKAEEIKKAILAEMIKKPEPVKEAVILGVTGWLYECSLAQWEDWRAVRNAVLDNGKPDTAQRRLAPAKLIQISFRDSEGNLVFDDADIALLSTLKVRQQDRLCRDISEINGFSDESIEGLVKNLIAITGVDGFYDILGKLGFPCPKCAKYTQLKNSEDSGSSSTTGPQVRPQKTGEQSSPA